MGSSRRPEIGAYPCKRAWRRYSSSSSRLLATHRSQYLDVCGFPSSFQSIGLRAVQLENAEITQLGEAWAIILQCPETYLRYRESWEAK